MTTALHIALVAVAFALWRRWLGGWGGNISKPLKIAVLALLTVAAWWPLPLASAPVPFGLLCLWFLVEGNNGGNGHPIRRYGPAGLGYLLEPYSARIPAMPWIGVSAGAWTEVAELWLGFVTGAALKSFSATEVAAIWTDAAIRVAAELVDAVLILFSTPV